jgi:ribosomal protein S18 acetylase RimI-like enzyme
MSVEDVSQVSLHPPRITPVRTVAELSEVRRLFEAYAASLDIDLGYQGFADELASLPGAYAPPAGELLLARAAAGPAIGCAALRPLPGLRLCEMKRLFVSPEGRGAGIGRKLVEAVIVAAVARGYGEMRLDTLPTMQNAQSLYRALGFVEIAPYYDTPVAGTVFLARRLG